MVITKRFYALAALVVASAATFSGAAPAAASVGGPPIPPAPGEEIDIVSVAEVMAQIENDSANSQEDCESYRGWAEWFNEMDLTAADRVATQEMLDAWFVYNWEYDAWRLSGEARDYLIDQLHNCLAIKPGDDL